MLQTAYCQGQFPIQNLLMQPWSNLYGFIHFGNGGKNTIFEITKQSLLNFLIILIDFQWFQKCTQLDNVKRIFNSGSNSYIFHKAIYKLIRLVLWNALVIIFFNICHMVENTKELIRNLSLSISLCCCCRINSTATLIINFDYNFANSLMLCQGYIKECWQLPVYCLYIC